MAETMERAYANCISTTAVVILDGASSTTYTILSLLFCQTGTAASFSLYRTDSGGSANKHYILKNVLMGSYKTFEHVDKIVLEASQELWFEASGSTNLDCQATFIKQTSPSDDELFKEHSVRLRATGTSWSATIDDAGAMDLFPAHSTATRTILSISLCNIHATQEIKFDIGMKDGGGSPSTHMYLYRHQPVPALSTFIHNSKIVIPPTDYLQMRTPISTSNTNLDMVVSYVEQAA